MRPLSILFVVLSLANISLSQEHILVTPGNDVIFLRGSEGTQAVIKKIRPPERMEPATPAQYTCDSIAIGGYPVSEYPSTIEFQGNHKDIMAMWFVAPYTGHIDTIFWSGGTNNGLDSEVVIRVHKSNIGPHSGPGFDFPGPCTNWGYYPNTNDGDQGIGAYPDEATGPWVSTVGSPYTSFPMMGDVMWGGSSGVSARHANGTNHVVMNDHGGPIYVAKGDTFWISMRIKGPNFHVSDGITSWMICDGWDPDKRVWKFYEHQTTSCGGAAVQGWKAREYWVFNWWFTMTIEENLPPTVLSLTNEAFPADSGVRFFRIKIRPAGTFNAGPFPITAEIVDCDLGNPSKAGIASADLVWSFTDQTQPNIPMSSSGINSYHAVIPPQLPGFIQYWVTARDSGGLSSTISHVNELEVLKTQNGWYVLDTGGAFQKKDISSTGTMIPPGQFFKRSPLGTWPGDDGTAGPIDIGGTMNFNGGPVRYVWIGVNGAIALTSSPVDTQEISWDGGWPAFFWTIPFRRNHLGVEDVPDNFVSPLFNDYAICFRDGTPSGKITYQQGFQGDSCVFVVEWDSVAYYDNFGCCGWSVQPDLTTFRVILNRCNSNIEFQYDNMGIFGCDSSSIVGIERDSTGPFPGDWLCANSYGYPTETRPRNDWSVRFLHNAITVTKSEDDDGLMATSTDRRNKTWDLSLYRNSVDPANLIAQRHASTLVVPLPTPGTYIACEADSGIYWSRINGNQTLRDTFEVTNEPVSVTFINSRKSIRITSPNGGEIWTPGSTYPITWVHTSLRDVRLEYSLNGGIDWVEITPSTPASTGSYPWYVPVDVVSPNVLVRVSDALHGEISDVSNAVFAIARPWETKTIGNKRHLNDVCFINTTTGWIVGNNGTVLHTSDGGVTWSEQTEGIPPSQPHLNGVSFINALSGWIAGDGGKILYSTDGGLHWTQQTSVTTNQLNDIYFADQLNGWTVGNGGVILATTDGGNHWFAQSGPTIEHLTGITFIDGATGWAIGTAGTILRTTNGGAAWTVQGSGSTEQLNDICFLDASHGWIVGNNGTILSTTDGGETWSSQASSTTRHLNGVSFVNVHLGWAVGNNGTILRYTSAGEIRPRSIRTSVVANQWSLVPAGTDLDLTTVAFIGGTFGGVFGDSGVAIQYRPTPRDSSYAVISVDIARHWNLLSVPMVLEDFGATAVLKGSISNAFAYNPLSGYEARPDLENGVGYWARFPHSKALNICGVAIGADTFDLVEGWNMVGSIGIPLPTGSIISEPGGLVTSNFYGYENGYVTAEEIQPGKGYWVKAYAGGRLILTSSPGASALARITIRPTSELPPLPPGVESAEDRSLPTEYKLEQAYPSPFNPSTTIKYQLPVDSRVTLKIYTVLGQVLDILADGLQSAGTKSVTWTAIDRPSAVYFYRLEAVSTADPGRSFVEVKKMMLVK